jgi:hypothetical protein
MAAVSVWNARSTSPSSRSAAAMYTDAVAWCRARRLKNCSACSQRWRRAKWWNTANDTTSMCSAVQP